MAKHVSNKRVTNLLNKIEKNGVESLDLKDKNTFEVVNFLVDTGQKLENLLWDYVEDKYQEET